MNRPTDRETLLALRWLAHCMGTECAYVFAGRFYFPVDARWSLALSPDDAGRFRVQACLNGRPRGTMWTLGVDRDRLADLAASFRAEVEALTT